MPSFSRIRNMLNVEHLRWLRLASREDSLLFTELPTYTTSLNGENWSADYSPPTGLLIRGNDVGAMRRALDQAMSTLGPEPGARTGATPLIFFSAAPGVRASTWRERNRPHAEPPKSLRGRTIGRRWRLSLGQPALLPCRLR